MCEHLCVLADGILNTRIKQILKTGNHGEGLETKLQNGGMLRQSTEWDKKKGIQREGGEGKAICSRVH